MWRRVRVAGGDCVDLGFDHLDTSDHCALTGDCFCGLMDVPGVGQRVSIPVDGKRPKCQRRSTTLLGLPSARYVATSVHQDGLAQVCWIS